MNDSFYQCPFCVIAVALDYQILVFDPIHAKIVVVFGHLAEVWSVFGRCRERLSDSLGTELG